MLTKDDVVKVTDFGLAKIQQTSAVTMTMGTGGTLFYMSPEQVRGLANVDQRGDIYSLGMTLYETLTGKTPFTESDTDFSIRQAIVEGKIPPPDRLRPDLPKDLVKVVMKAIDKDPAKRFQTAAEMWTALEKVQIPLPVVDKGTTIDRGGSRSFDPQTKSRRMVYLAIAGVTAVVLFFALRLWMSSPSTTLSISSEPNGSKVFFNGDSVGMTPLTNITVRPGNLSLRLDREGYYTKDTALVLTKGENVSIGVPLRKIQTAPPETAENFPPASSTKSGKAKGSQPKEQSKQTGMATLSLRAMPTGFVTVDGTMRSGNTNQVTTVEVASGERTILFEHPVYGSKILQLTLTPGETKTITCYFESYVSIQSLPVWGTIMIDGKNTDVSTPKDRYPLGVGKHRVTVTRAGYETVEGDKEITIMPAFKENVYQLVFNLRKK
jgi:serine/threonine protein kinase